MSAERRNPLSSNPKLLRLLSALVALAVVAFAGYLTARGGDDPAVTATAPVSATATPTTSTPTTATPTTSTVAQSSRARAAPVASSTRVAGVPERAYVTLAEIDAGRWPGSANAPGTKGGEQWMNRDGDLPRAGPDGRVITYREWDVNPKQSGRSRDAERIVTGSDDSAWYTGDHYETFTRMR